MPSGSFSDVKSLHVRGHICIARDKSHLRKEFLTCGADGTVYLWDEKCFKENKPPEVVNIGEATNSCIVWKGENVYLGCTTINLLLGTEKKIIGKCKIDDLSSISPALIFGLDPVAVDVGDSFLVAGGSDFTVKISRIGDGSNYMRLEMNTDVMSVALSPNEKFCAISTSDGKVSVYDIVEAEPKQIFCEKVFGQTNATEIESPRVKLAWSSTGDELYVPALGVVKMVDAVNWNVSSKMFRAGKDAEYEDFSTLTVSPCGSYLAASTVGNHLVIWKISDCEIISQNVFKRITQGKNIISDMAFNPMDGRSLILTDANEGLCVWKNALPAGLGEISTTSASIPENNSGVESEENSDDDDENNTIIKKKSKIIDDEAEDDEDVAPAELDEEDTRMSADIGAIKRKYQFSEDRPGRLEDFGFGPIDIDQPQEDLTEKSVSTEAAKITKIIEYEPPTIPSHFVSGATSAHHTKRYLKWNRFGIVRSYNEQDNCTLEIEFHDGSIHPEMIIENSTSNYTLADLSDQAVVLASSPEEKSFQSEILVIHFKSWDPESRRWTTKLPNKEIAIDVLVSADVVCVLTTQRNIRVFSITGTQRQIISHPGPILTSALHGYKLSIASINGAEYYEEYQRSKRSKATYQYSVTTYNVDIRGWMGCENSVSSCNLPVTPGKRPLWLSYSNTGQLVSMDNDYNVRMKTPSGFWMPIFDSSNRVIEKSDGIWPISVVAQGITRQFRYLYCKGSRHPSFSTKQVPIVADWSLPYCQNESEKTKLEQALLLNELQQNIANEVSGSAQEFSAVHLQTLVKLFALACKSERETRASELATFVNSSKGIQVMCNYATTLKKNVLAEKVACVGRENLSDPSSAPKMNRNTPSIAPRRVSMKRRTIDVQQPSVAETISQADSVDIFEEKDEFEKEDEEASHNNTTIVSGNLPAVSTPFNRNPFKRAGEVNLDSSSLSVFDQLESSFDNPKKRAREDETSQTQLPSAKRQMKLAFSAGSVGKENKK